MIIGIGADPNASALKQVLIDYATALGHIVRDFGSDDPLYARVAADVAHAVVDAEVERGVLLCGTGIGVSIAANKVAGAYCALVSDDYQAERAQLSNAANLIAMGAQVTGPETAKRMLGTYLGNAFDETSPSAPKVAEIKRVEAEAQ